MRIGKRLGREDTRRAVDIVVVVIIGGSGIELAKVWWLDRIGVFGSDGVFVDGGVKDVVCCGKDDEDMAVVGNGEGMVCVDAKLSSADGRAECILDGGRLAIAELVPVLGNASLSLSVLVIPLVSSKAPRSSPTFLALPKNHFCVQKNLTMPWNVNVSDAQSSKKNRYWFKMLWLARKFAPRLSLRVGGVTSEVIASVALIAKEFA